ncbi:cytochrome b [Rheinheimera sp.]|uniref:cytochrome b n=1 Tax=Rheinheimera sp. TaxID=1869214 RepID=UPI0027BA1196|nr:cytochrome b [Rheinheimera sp.]
MSSEIRNLRFSQLTVLLHWVTVLLFIAVYCSMEFRDIFERGTTGRELMKTTHYWFGLSILLLLLPRLLARFRQHTPAIEPPQPHWQHKLAIWVHLALYVLMLLMPLIGWLLLSAEGKELSYLGLQLPALMAPNEVWAERFEELHELGAKAGYALIAVHALAALFHHYVLKDNTVKRMMLK